MTNGETPITILSSYEHLKAQPADRTEDGTLIPVAEN